MDEKGDVGERGSTILNWNSSSLYTCIFVRLKVKVVN